jgi:hypothetical protein
MIKSGLSYLHSMLVWNKLNISKKHLYSQNVVAYITSIFYGCYLLFPLTPWIRFTGYTEKPIPYFPYSDTSFYLLQIKSLIENNGDYSNPYFYEHMNSPMSISDSHFIWVWSAIARILSLDAIQIYITLMFFTGIVTYLITYRILSSFKLKSLNSNLMAAATFFWLLPIAAMGRPSPTQTTLWIVLLNIYLICNHTMNSEKKIPWKIGLVLVALFLFNGIYAIYFCILAFLLAVFYSDFRKNYLTLILPISLIGSIYLSYSKLNSSPESLDLRSRLGFLETHLPGSIRLSTITVLLAIILFKIVRYRKFIKPYLLSIMSLPIAANQNLLSGKWWQPEAHYWFLMIILVAIGLYILLNYILSILKPLILFTAVKFIFLMIFIFGLSQSLISVNNLRDETLIGTKNNDGQYHLIQELNRSGIKNQVILQDSGVGSINLSEEALLLTDSYMYWHSLGSLYEASNQEILQRFACTLGNKPYSISDFSNDSRRIYIYQFLNSDMFFTKWNRLSNATGLINKYQSRKKVTLEADYDRLIEIRETACNPLIYKADWILTSEGRLVRTDSNVLGIFKGER